MAGVWAEVVSGGGTEAISRGRRLLLILTLKTTSFRRSVDKKKPDPSSLFSPPVKGNIRIFCSGVRWLRAERRLLSPNLSRLVGATRTGSNAEPH